MGVSVTASLLSYTAKKWPSFKHGFGLGNEKEFAVSAEDTAGCYNTLRGYVDTLWPKKGGRPIIIGPDLNTRPDWLSRFIAACVSLPCRVCIASRPSCNRLGLLWASCARRHGQAQAEAALSSPNARGWGPTPGATFGGL